MCSHLFGGFSHLPRIKLCTWSLCGSPHALDGESGRFISCSGTATQHMVSADILFFPATQAGKGNDTSVRPRCVRQWACCASLLSHPRRSDWYICSGPLLAGEPILVCFGQYSHHMRKGILVHLGILYRLTHCRLASAQHLVVGPRSCCRIMYE